jgi:alcohol dehydrogenase class IV
MSSNGAGEKAVNLDSLSGHWKPRINLRDLFYGPKCVETNLLGCMPSPSSRAFIITGNSLATRTPLVNQLETLLGVHHAGTISNIRQHGPIEDVERAVSAVLDVKGVDVLVSLGGGSPIDTAKVISYRVKEARGNFLTHLTIPTTLSAAECTGGGGYTQDDGTKIGFRDPGMGVSAIFYDPEYTRYTPKKLWLSTGMRAMDHAVECMYHPAAAEVPWKALSSWAAGELFDALPKAAGSGPHDDDNNTVRLMLAAYASSGLKGENLPGGMGLSHSLGHALGSPYGIAHGETSCITLAKVVQLVCQESSENAHQLARLLPAAGGQRTGNDQRDAMELGERIEALVRRLGLGPVGLQSLGVSKDQIPVIVQKVMGGVREGPRYERLTVLVESLF